MIIAIEGIDGSGKATQSRILADRLHFPLVSFPNYATNIGQLILGNLQGTWCAEKNALMLQALMTVNRLETHIPKDCVLDRYWASGVVYGSLDGLDREWLRRIHELLPTPQLWILLDVPPEESTLRRPERRDRYERDAGLMERARVAYLRLAKQTNWCVVNGRGTVAEVAERVWDCVVKIT